MGNDLPLSHRIPNRGAGLNIAVCWSAQDARVCLAFDAARLAGIGFGRTRVENSTERMTAISLNDSMAVDASGETGAERHHQRRIVDRRAEVALFHARIDDDDRPERRQRITLRIDQQRNRACRQHVINSSHTVHPLRRHTFDGERAADGGVAKSDGAAHKQRGGQLQDDYGEASPIQPKDRAAAEVAAAAYDNAGRVKERRYHVRAVGRPLDPASSE